MGRRGDTRTALAVLATAALALAACAGGEPTASPADEVVTVTPALPTPEVTGSPAPGCVDTADDASYPDVVDATARRDGDEWELTATLCSPYDSAARYADAWRALDPDGNVLAVRDLSHPHAGEQPFTRGTSIPLPSDVTTLVFEGRDSVNGWGGGTVEVEIR